MAICFLCGSTMLNNKCSNSKCVSVAVEAKVEKAEKAAQEAQERAQSELLEQREKAKQEFENSQALNAKTSI